MKKENTVTKYILLIVTITKKLKRKQIPGPLYGTQTSTTTLSLRIVRSNRNTVVPHTPPLLNSRSEASP